MMIDFISCTLVLELPSHPSLFMLKPIHCMCRHHCRTASLAHWHPPRWFTRKRQTKQLSITHHFSYVIESEWGGGDGGGRITRFLPIDWIESMPLCTNISMTNMFTNTRRCIGVAVNISNDWTKNVRNEWIETSANWYSAFVCQCPLMLTAESKPTTVVKLIFQRAHCRCETDDKCLCFQARPLFNRIFFSMRLATIISDTWMRAVAEGGTCLFSSGKKKLINCVFVKFNAIIKLFTPDCFCFYLKKKNSIMNATSSHAFTLAMISLILAEVGTSVAVFSTSTKTTQCLKVFSFHLLMLFQ